MVGLGGSTMAVYRLTEDLIFPHPSLANSDGLLAAYGDLSPQRLLWPIATVSFLGIPKVSLFFWWSPDPRFILYPKDIRISSS